MKIRIEFEDSGYIEAQTEKPKDMKALLEVLKFALIGIKGERPT